MKEVGFAPHYFDFLLLWVLPPHSNIYVLINLWESGFKYNI